MSDEAFAQDLPEGAFVGREALRARVRGALLAAAAQRWREIIICDADFADWPLNERPVVEALGHWVRHAQGFVMLARRYDSVARLHPLFVEWRRTWSHKIDCRVCQHADPQDLPSALWSPGWALQRTDSARSAGVSGPEAERRVVLRETLEEWLRRSTSGFPATTLGL